jgi:hypothetical protein
MTTLDGTPATTETTETDETKPQAKTKVEAKRVRKGSSRRKHGRTKTPKTAKATKSKAAPRAAKKGRWSDEHAQLVLHCSHQLLAAFDRKLKGIAKRLKLSPATRGKGMGRITRGQVIRALVERACKG